MIKTGAAPTKGKKISKLDASRENQGGVIIIVKAGQISPISCGGPWPGQVQFSQTPIGSQKMIYDRAFRLSSCSQTSNISGSFHPSFL